MKRHKEGRGIGEAWKQKSKWKSVGKSMQPLTQAKSGSDMREIDDKGTY